MMAMRHLKNVVIFIEIIEFANSIGLEFYVHLLYRLNMI